jgi:hypothetical protein
MVYGSEFGFGGRDYIEGGWTEEGGLMMKK